jgi:hypothetical protein
MQYFQAAESWIYCFFLSLPRVTSRRSPFFDREKDRRNCCCFLSVLRHLGGCGDGPFVELSRRCGSFLDDPHQGISGRSSDLQLLVESQAAECLLLIHPGQNMAFGLSTFTEEEGGSSFVCGKRSSSRVLYTGTAFAQLPWPLTRAFSRSSPLKAASSSELRPAPR